MEDQSTLRWGILSVAFIGGLLLIALALWSKGDLTGETWVAEEFVIGGTATPPIPGTAVSAVFDGETVTGVAGCNSYFAGYEVDGDAIAFGLVGSTEMFCGEPPGVMDQELAYLGLLGSADEFEVSGRTLTLFAGGEAIVVFSAGG